MPRKLAHLLIAVALLGCTSGDAESRARPEVLPETRYEGCFNGVGFFEVDRADLAARLPEGFTPRDGAFMGSEYEGKGMLALLYYACPASGDVRRRLALIATPVEPRPLAPVLREVRWSWYELARFGHEPFREGDTVAEFRVSVQDGEVFSVRAALTDPIDFAAQSHRFWHEADDGRLISARLDFADHHSWIGSFHACDLQPRLLPTDVLDGIECSGRGITEAIETLDFTEQVVLWN